MPAICISKFIRSFARIRPRPAQAHRPINLSAASREFRVRPARTRTSHAPRTGAGRRTGTQAQAGARRQACAGRSVLGEPFLTQGVRDRAHALREGWQPGGSPAARQPGSAEPHARRAGRAILRACGIGRTPCVRTVLKFWQAPADNKLARPEPGANRAPANQRESP